MEKIMKIQNNYCLNSAKSSSFNAKQNAPSFKGNVFFLDDKLVAVNELKLYKKIIEAITSLDLDVFIVKPPIDDAEIIKIKIAPKTYEERIKNLGIIYHNKDTHDVRSSILYLYPNEGVKKNIIKKNNRILYQDLFDKAYETIDDNAWSNIFEKILKPFI